MVFFGTLSIRSDTDQELRIRQAFINKEAAELAAIRVL